MAKIKQGILGGFSGKVGGVVGSSWKGIAVMKAKPLSVANPRTASQVIQRTKFKGAIKLGSTILNSCCKPLFNQYAQQKSGYNDFVAMNIPAFKENGDPELSLLMLSPDGGAESLKAKLEEVGADVELKANWDPNDGGANALGTDLPFLYIVDRTGEVIGQSANSGATRADGHLLLTLTKPILALDITWTYLIFKSADNKRVFGQGAGATEWV